MGGEYHTFIFHIITLCKLCIDMEVDYLCTRCAQFRSVDIPAHYARNEYGYRTYYPREIGYECKATLRAVSTLRTQCKFFISVDQRIINIGGDGMVKLNVIPSEGERIELDKLPKEIELIAVNEKTVGDIDGKAGGLIIRYQLRDGRSFPQKYTKLSGYHLMKALKTLRVKDTEDLQKSWFIYTLKPMRMGYPRMIPIKKVKV